MRKKTKFARAARLARKIAEFSLPFLLVVKVIVEIVSKAANCNGKLSVQVSVAR
jgi:hypothetical protein